MRTPDIYTLVGETKTLLVDFESGNTMSILKNFLWVSILYLLFLPLLESRHLDANVSSSIPSTCLQKYLHHSSFLPFSLPVGRISETSSVSSNPLYLRMLFLCCQVWVYLVESKVFLQPDRATNEVMR